MTKASPVVTPFSFRGKLTKISYQKKKLKYIKLVAEQGKYWIKVPKKLREKISSLSCGCQLEISGTSKPHSKTGKTRYKAKTIVLIPQDKEQTVQVKTKTVSLLPVFDRQLKSKAKVLICQKSNCWKKGGKKVCQELETILGDRGLIGQLQIKKTGCLNQCKKAPALVMMPDKARYNRVKPKQVEALVDNHLIAK